MNSPTHRANITKPNYTQIGTGVAEGTYQGSPTIFVVQVFGVPAAATVATKPEVPVATSKTPETVAVAETPAPDVLGAESAPAPAAAISVPDVQPEEPAVTKGISDHQSNAIQRFLASPRNTMNTLLFVIMGIVALAVFLNIGIKISHHHPDLIINGVMAIAIMSCVFVVNNYISKSNIQLVQSVNYSEVETNS